MALPNRWGKTYDWDLWGAAYLINGGASDDGFDYFRGWLLSQGSERWAKVTLDLESAFDDIQPGALSDHDPRGGAGPANPCQADSHASRAVSAAPKLDLTA